MDEIIDFITKFTLIYNTTNGNAGVMHYIEYKSCRT